MSSAVPSAPAGSDPLLGPLPSELPTVERRATIAAGLAAGATTAGIKASGRPDLAVIVTTGEPAAAAAVFTRNAFAAAPVKLSQAHLAASVSPVGDGRSGWARAIIATSGSANAATGAAGEEDQLEIANELANTVGIPVASTLLLSTGLIGTRLPLDKVRAGLRELWASGVAATDEALEAAAVALRTTDSTTKIATVALTLPGLDAEPVAVRVTGIAKGVGMIHPRMATMLAVVLTDANVEPTVLLGLLRPAAARTWDQLSVDGDTSTNDTVFVLASGAAGTAPLAADSEAAAAFGGALEAVARDLARQQAADGEGATTLVTCQVSGASYDAEARAVARAVVSSSLVKAAAHGRDPNWGRIAGAAGNARLADRPVLEASGMEETDATRLAGQPVGLDPDRLRIAIAGQLVFDGNMGGPVDFDREAARTAMDAPEVLIRLDLGLGQGSGEAFGCDLTEAYVIENSEYTT
ncbi:MAG: bifunctional ornithine acetyltransferase/N-acetylglutamate synthase [Chloroflexota bacterium]